MNKTFWHHKRPSPCAPMHLQTPQPSLLETRQACYSTHSHYLQSHRHNKILFTWQTTRLMCEFTHQLGFGKKIAIGELGVLEKSERKIQSSNGRNARSGRVSANCFTHSLFSSFLSLYLPLRFTHAFTRDLTGVYAAVGGAGAGAGAAGGWREACRRKRATLAATTSGESLG